MTPQDSMTNDKVFRFISDAGHKENLSGRVRAACVTCRRKKIKCSGEVPCGTCEEKGILCEGLTERKRPKKTTEYRRSHTTSSQSVRSPPPTSHPVTRDTGGRSLSRESRPVPSTTKTDQRSRPATLQKLNTNSNDSGYSSGRQSHAEDTPAGTRPRPSPHLSMNPLADYDSSTETSPLTMEPQDWSFITRQSSGTYCPTETAESDISHSTHLVSATGSTKSAEWPEATDRTSWWPDSESHGQAANNLISAAEVLEEQAQSLRRLASRQSSDVMDDARRQTIAFPLQTTSSAPSSCSPQTQPAAFDDMALLLSERTSGSGITPRACDFASWWDVNPELSTSLGFHSNPAALSLIGGFPATSATGPADTGWPLSVANNPISARPSNASSAQPRQTGAHQKHTSPSSYDQYYPWPE